MTSSRPFDGFRNEQTLPSDVAEKLKAAGARSRSRVQQSAELSREYLEVMCLAGLNVEPGAPELMQPVSGKPASKAQVQDFVQDIADAFMNAGQLVMKRNDSSPDLTEELFRIAPFSLGTLDSIQELVEWLYEAGRLLGLAAIRYHYLSRSDNRLVSVESAGHSPEVTARIRNGQIHKSPQAAPPDQFDSYLCFDCGRPTVFLVDEASSGIERISPLQGILPCYGLQADRCENVLPDKGRLWCDFPLIASGRFIGKLSCDIAANALRDIDVAQLLRFWQLAQFAAAHFNSLYSSAVATSLDRCRDEIWQCPGIESLLDYLAVVFHCDYVNLFRSVEDTEGRKLLVLSHTNCPSLKVHEDCKAYPLENSEFLVPQIASSGQCLRFENLASQESRAVDAFGLTINWEDPLLDWRDLGSLVTAPVLTSQRTWGVIQLAHRRTNFAPLASFSDHDQRLLKRLARECVGERLESIENTGFDWQRCFRWAATVNRLNNNANVPLTEQVVALLREAFPEGDSRKLYLLSGLGKGDGTFRTMIAQGALSRASDLREFPLENSITDRAVREESGRAVYWIGGAEWLTPGAVCGLACRVACEGRPIGSIVVKSDRYDLGPEQGYLLQTIAEKLAPLLESSAVLTQEPV